MKQLSFLLFLLLFLMTSGKSQINYQKELKFKNKVVLMKPTGKTTDGLPEMTTLHDTSLLYRTAINNINNSFIDEFIDIYFIAQVYLKNQNKLVEIEPAYLALTEKEGGFAKFGFSIKKNDQSVLKKQVPYIDITKDRGTAPIDKLMSLSQLYPHEMGHVLYHLLCDEDTLEFNTKNINIHYFSIITDFSTAFNEGFSEHIENVSRYFEKNEPIRKGIANDIERIENRSKTSINGFKRDFLYKIRLGYYKVSMLVWYQQLEDYKRYVQAFNGDIRYKNESLELSSIKDWISYRNSGVRLDKNKKRNLVQLHSTEGAVSAFFTLLSTSELQNNYMPANFYKPFLPDSNMTIEKPRDFFNPLQNQFVKYIYVLHKFVVENNSSKSQLTDFIDGYLQSFPDEAKEVKNLYKKALGIDYTNELPPPLWLMVKNYNHRLLVLDPFGAITVPMYTFDLNAAETEDLLTIKGIEYSEAQKIIDFREDKGLFTSFSQLKNISGLTNEIINKIESTQFDVDYFEKTFENYELKLNFSDLLIKPLQYLFVRAGIYFLVLIVLFYFLFAKRENLGIKKAIGLFIKYLLLWILFVLLGLTSVILLEKAYLISLILFALPSGLALLIYRKRKPERNRTLLMISVMSLMILASIL